MRTARCPSTVFALCGALLLVACTDRELPGLNVAFPIPVPAAAGAIGPRLAANGTGMTTLSWMEHTDEGAVLRYSDFQGGAWQAAKSVATDANMFVNWADRPAVTPLGDQTLLAHWLRRSAPDPHAYDIVALYSYDDGEQWQAQLTPHDDMTPTEHGFVSVLANRDGANLLWLDGRKMMNEVTDDVVASGMTLRGASVSSDGVISDEVVVDDLVCECCPTDVANTPAGAIAVYRNRSIEEIRDIYVTRQENGVWQSGVAVSNDNWMITGCPVNGPSIAANEKLVAVAWFSAANDKPVVRSAFSTNAGESFSLPVEIAQQNSLGQVGVATIASDSFAVSWLESSDDGGYLINVRTLTTDGQISEVITAGRTKMARQIPDLARVGDKLIVVWTDYYNDENKIVSVQLPIVNFYDL